MRSYMVIAKNKETGVVREFFYKAFYDDSCIEMFHWENKGFEIIEVSRMISV